MPIRDVCKCQCHRQSILEVLNFRGVDTRDFVECVSACESCRWHHADVLTVGYEQGQREPTVWVDPPTPQADATGDKGEGPEA